MAHRIKRKYTHHLNELEPHSIDANYVPWLYRQFVNSRGITITQYYQRNSENRIGWSGHRWSTTRATPDWCRLSKPITIEKAKEMYPNAINI